MNPAANNSPTLRDLFDLPERVNPGDFVLADDDGVVVVPADVEAEVFARANERATRETEVPEELQGGATLASVWSRYRVL